MNAERRRTAADENSAGGHSILTWPSCVLWYLIISFPDSDGAAGGVPPTTAPRAVYKSNLLSIIIAICHFFNCQRTRDANKVGFNKVCAEPGEMRRERGEEWGGWGGSDHWNGPELLVRQSANITALMCSGSVGPRSSDGTKWSLWLLNTSREEVLHYPAVTGPWGRGCGAAVERPGVGGVKYSLKHSSTSEEKYDFNCSVRFSFGQLRISQTAATFRVWILKHLNNTKTIKSLLLLIC